MKKIHCWAEGEVELWCGFDKALAQLATYSSILAWEISWTEEPGRLQSMGSQKSDTTEHSHTRARAHTHTHTHTLAQLAGSSGVRRAHWPALLCPQMHATQKRCDLQWDGSSQLRQIWKELAAESCSLIASPTAGSSSWKDLPMQFHVYHHHWVEKGCLQKGEIDPIHQQNQSWGTEKETQKEARVCRRSCNWGQSRSYHS